MSKLKYSYQSPLVDQTWEILKADGKCVLAAAPGAGKTEMSIELICKFLIENPGKKVLFLAHGQRSLRQDTARRFTKTGKFSVAEFGGDSEENADVAQVHVALPHAKHRLPKDYGLIVQDEGHHYYWGKMCRKLYAQSPDAKQLILTASHWRFTKEKEVKVVCYSQWDLLQREVICEPTLKPVTTTQDFRSFDYSSDIKNGKAGDLKESVKLTDVQSILDQVRRFIKKNKTLVACHNQDAARDVYHGLQAMGYSVALSTSDYDPDGYDWEKFIDISDDTQIVVVVHRGVVGFNMPRLSLVIDLTASKNPERVFQLMGRVVRYEDGKRPVYVKMMPKAAVELYHMVLSASMHLAIPSVYEQWDGTLDSLKQAVAKSVIHSKVLKKEGPRLLFKGKLVLPKWSELVPVFQGVEAGNSDTYEVISLQRLMDLRNENWWTSCKTPDDFIAGMRENGLLPPEVKDDQLTE